MPFTKRISVIMPFDQSLAPNQNELKWAIVDEIEAMGYQSEMFFDPRGKPGLAAAKAWSAAEADRVTRHCIGAVLIGMPRWKFSTPQGAVLLPTEFCYYEGAIAYTLRLPMLILVQQDVIRRVVFDNSYDGYIGEFPATLIAAGCPRTHSACRLIYGNNSWITDGISFSAIAALR